MPVIGELPRGEGTVQVRSIAEFFRGPFALRYQRRQPQREDLSAYTSRVLVHGFESKSKAAGFDSSAVCFARFVAGRRVAIEPLGDAQP